MVLKVTPYSYLAQGDWVLKWHERAQFYTDTWIYIMQARETRPVLAWKVRLFLRVFHAEFLFF